MVFDDTLHLGVWNSDVIGCISPGDCSSDGNEINIVTNKTTTTATTKTTNKNKNNSNSTLPDYKCRWSSYQKKTF